MENTLNDTSSLEEKESGDPCGTESLLPVKSDASVAKQSKSTPGPLTPEYTRTKILEAAGVTVEEMGKLARGVIDKTASLMEAKKVRLFADKGIIMSEREVEDNQTQLGASKQAGEIVGLFSSKSSGGGPNKLEVIINLPGWAEIKTK